MNVKELKKAIANLPDEMEVILQKDSEGNGYSPLAGADNDAVFLQETGDVYSTEWSASEAAMSIKEWKKLKSNPRVLVLYPE